MTGSDHGWTLGGDANLSGSFYNPNFLSYNASVYLNQSRANSNYQSISDASGFDLTSNIFGGSRFPGSISYSKAFNSEGNYAVPGLANYVTHGNNNTFGVNWSENLPDAPSLSAGFQLGNSQYSVYGTNDQGQQHVSFAQPPFGLPGWRASTWAPTIPLGGGHSLIPEVVSGQQNTETNQTNSIYGFNRLAPAPLAGLGLRPRSTAPPGTPITWAPLQRNHRPGQRLCFGSPRPKNSPLGQRELLRQPERATGRSRSSAPAAGLPVSTPTSRRTPLTFWPIASYTAVARICKPQPSSSAAPSCSWERTTE